MKLPKKLITSVCATSLMLSWATAGVAAVDHSQPMYWTDENSGTTETLNDVWGSSASNIFAVGNNGTILHYNGSSWSSMTSPVSDDLNSIWGRSSNDIYAVGNSGAQIHYNGSTWSTMGAIPHPTGIVSDVYGSSSETYCATYGPIEGGTGGGEVMKLYSNWESRSSEDFGDPNDRIYDRINAVYVQESTGYVFVGGWNLDNGDPVLWRKTGSAGFFRYPYVDGYQATLDIWGTGNTTYFVGADYTIGQNNNRGIVLRDVNGQQSFWELNDVGDIMGVWGTAANSVFFAANYGEVLHFNGSSWIKSITGTDSHLHGVWGSSDGNVYAVGANGTILHYDENYQAEAADLVSPTDNSVQSGTSVSFDWDPASWADGYRLQISETEDMSRLVLNTDVGSATDITISGFENYGRPYFWRVIADDGYGHEINSEIFRFDNGTALSPILITPGNGENVPGTAINFQWHQFENAIGYYFQLATDANYTNVLVGGMVYDTELLLTGFGDSGTSYYWRVLDYDGSSFGPYWSYSHLFVNGTP